MIRDWSIAQELDVKAALYVRDELRDREADREKRDREFWIKAFGGDVPQESESDSEPNVTVTVTERTEDEVIFNSPLGRR